jgi:hypothetical protein
MKVTKLVPRHSSRAGAVRILRVRQRPEMRPAGTVRVILEVFNVLDNFAFRFLNLPSFSRRTLYACYALRDSKRGLGRYAGRLRATLEGWK